MSRYTDVLLRGGEIQARLAEARAKMLGQTVSDISQLPFQALQAHRQQQRLDAQTALEMARELRLRGQEQRAQQLEQQAHADLEDKRYISGKAWSGGAFDPEAAVSAATERQRQDLIPEIQETAQKLKPKLTPITTGTDEGGKTTQFVEPTPGLTITSPPPTPAIGTIGAYLATKLREKGSALTAADIAAATKEFKTAEQPTPSMTPYQTAELGMQGQRLSLEKQKAAQAQADKTELTPEGLDAAALMFSKTGQLPALGMGDKTTRKAIINRAAQLTPGLDIASAKADFAANSATLTQLEKQRAAIGAFEQTASKNIDVFLETAGKVVDTGSPLANTLFRQASGKLLGSPDQARYDAARQVAVNEIAKITSNPTLAGTLSDSARHEVEAFNPANATLAQSVAVMRLLKRDMQNRTSSLDDQISAIRDRIKKGSQSTPSTDAPASKTVTLTELAAVAKRRGTTVDQERARYIQGGYAVVK